VKNITKRIDGKIVIVSLSIGIRGISRRNNRRPKLEVSPQNGLERDIITELDNKATLQTSIKWDSTD
jgi:hypothetical protein